MDRIRTEYFGNREVLIIDYSGCSEAAMIDIVTRAKNAIVNGNKVVLIVSIFNHKSFLTPGFMRHLEKEVKEVDHLIARNAVTGLSEVKKWILKGFNLFLKEEIRNFDSVDEAMRFVVKDT